VARTLAAAATTCAWEGHQINLIDTPGHIDFTAEVERSLRVLDGGVVALDAVAGVEPQTETVWRQADRHGVPRLVFVNKMDRAGASFARCLEGLRERLGARAVAIQIPIGAESAFEGVIDLVTMESLNWLDEAGRELARGPVPPALQGEARRARAALVEAVAETGDALLAAYLERGDLTGAELRAGLRAATLANRLVPVLCGSALRNRGVQPLLDAVVAYLPSPADLPPVVGVNPIDGEAAVRAADPAAPLAALVFKVVSDPFAGRLAYVRVYAGTLSGGATVLNTSRDRRERVGRLVRMHADHRTDVASVEAGDIAAIVGLKGALTGDSLCDPGHPIVLEAMEFPEPVVAVAIEPRAKGDGDRMGVALARLADEDPTFRVGTDGDSGQTVISGMGELHLEILVDRLWREFEVATAIGPPRVAYRETVAGTARAEGRWIRQSGGGSGQWGHVWLEVAPAGRGDGVIFENRVVGGAVPREYVPAVEAGVREAAAGGVLAGYPVVDVRVALVGGSAHEQDSSELAFRIAAGIGFKEGVRAASPTLLEPVMRVEVTTPEEFVGDVLGDLTARRGTVEGMEGAAGRGGAQVVRALVPLARLFGYTTDLRSMTQGRAQGVMALAHYAAIPAALAGGVAQAARA
jgi:elongation factor G